VRFVVFYKLIKSGLQYPATKVRGVKMKKLKMLSFIITTFILLLTTSNVLSANYTFTPRLNITSYYTDNLFKDEEDEQDDFVTTVTLGLAAGVKTQSAGLDGYFDPKYQFYNDFNELNKWLFDAGLNGFVDITKNTRLSLYDRFAKRNDTLSQGQINAARSGDPTESLDPTERQGRSAFWRNTVNVQLDHQFGVENSVFLRYNNRLLRNDDSDRFEDSDGHRGDIGLTYYWTPQWGFGVTGTYVRGIFDPSNDFIGVPSDDFNAYGGSLRLIRNLNRRTKGFVEYTYSHLAFDNGSIVSVAPEVGAPQVVLNEDYDVHSPQIGVEYAIEEDITLTASGGYFWQVPDITKTRDGWVLNLLLRKTLRRGGVRFEAGGGYDYSYFTTQNLGFTRFYRAGVTGNYEIFRRFYGDAYASYRRNEYLDAIPQRDDDRYLAGGGVTWQATRWAAIRLGYQLNKVDSNRDNNDYTENRILLNLSFAPDLPFRALY
jgi:hypothetical protein